MKIQKALCRIDFWGLIGTKKTEAHNHPVGPPANPKELEAASVRRWGTRWLEPAWADGALESFGVNGGLASWWGRLTYKPYVADPCAKVKLQC